MKRSLLRSWLGVGLLGLATVVGCRHAEECECCCECQTVQPVVTPVPVAPVAPAPVTPPKKVEAPATDESQVRTVAHKVEPAHDVLATVVSPDGKGGIAGTMALTASDAEGMGIRPGYTPDALYTTPSTPNNPVLHLTGAQELVPATDK